MVRLPVGTLIAAGMFGKGFAPLYPFRGKVAQLCDLCMENLTATTFTVYTCTVEISLVSALNCRLHTTVTRVRKAFQTRVSFPLQLDVKPPSQVMLIHVDARLLLVQAL